MFHFLSIFKENFFTNFSIGFNPGRNEIGRSVDSNVFLDHLDNSTFEDDSVHLTVF
jgi:hypothetical protein